MIDNETVCMKFSFEELKHSATETLICLHMEIASLYSVSIRIKRTLETHLIQLPRSCKNYIPGIPGR